MSIPSPRPVPSSPVPWGIALAAGSLLLIGGGTLIWSLRDRAPTNDQNASQVADLSTSDEAGPTPDVKALRRGLPLPPNAVGLHSVIYGVENGTRVVKIKVTATGDELVVDAATGRFLEARPGRSTAPPPMGKFVAPFDPMT